ncbi:MAG: TylF/MycF/NovP-related O-methyltransferase, partial [Chloroflexota bacterium]|nr:TylF/MycF/NovP-related O-methyltransferase [Chloroflexota bacterium]
SDHSFSSSIKVGPLSIAIVSLPELRTSYHGQPVLSKAKTQRSILDIICVSVALWLNWQVADCATCAYTKGVSSNNPSKSLGAKWSNRVAALSFHFLYYRQLLAVFIQNIRLSRPGSLRDSFKTVRQIHQVRGYTAVFPHRLATLYRLSKDVDARSVPGDIVECGVYNGGSSALMASVCTKSPLNRNIWLFDSFEGLPQPTENDGELARTCGWWCHGDLSMVKTVFQKLCIPEPRVNTVKGWFHETFPTVQIHDIALLHIDADWYDSVKLCFERFYDNVQPGGYIVIDDYGHWEGCRKATDEFLKERSLNIKLTQVDYTGHYFQKP